jgi:hypothetical protein
MPPKVSLRTLGPYRRNRDAQSLVAVGTLIANRRALLLLTISKPGDDTSSEISLGMLRHSVLDMAHCETLARATEVLHRAPAAKSKPVTLSRFDDHLLLQCPHRPRGANGNSHRPAAAHDRRALSLPGLQGAVWTLRPVNPADHGRAPIAPSANTSSLRQPRVHIDARPPSPPVFVAECDFATSVGANPYALGLDLRLDSIVSAASWPG